MKNIRIKRVYDIKSEDDGYRILVDRIWPRGIKKEDLKVDEWNRLIAPSTQLRKWFDHQPERWEEFVQRYSAELHEKIHELRRIKDISVNTNVTLLYSARDPDHNQARVLQMNLQKL